MNPDFRDMLFALCDENVEFLLVGAYALSVHGFPRATGDLDIWIRRSTENAQRVWRALQQFRAPVLNLRIEDLKTPDVVFQIGKEPRRIDILTSISGIEFEDAWPNRRETQVEGRTIGVLGRAELLLNKKTAGRPKDLADVAWLESNDPASN